MYEYKLSFVFGEKNGEEYTYEKPRSSIFPVDSIFHFRMKGGWGRFMEDVWDKSMKDTVCVVLDSEITCRETLVYYIRTVHSLFYSSGSASNMKIIVDIFADSYAPVRGFDKFKEIFDKFKLQNLGMDYYITSESTSRIVIALEAPHQHRLWYLASAFAYVMRKEEILDALLEYEITSKSFGNFLSTTMLKLLSEGFLKNPGWGNSSNSTLGLSIFFYMASQNDMCFSMMNGPSNFGLRVSPTQFRNYFNAIFLKVFPKMPYLVDIVSEISQDDFAGFQAALAGLYLKS